MQQIISSRNNLSIEEATKTIISQQQQRKRPLEDQQHEVKHNNLNLSAIVGDQTKFMQQNGESFHGLTALNEKEEKRKLSKARAQNKQSKTSMEFRGQKIPLPGANSIGNYKDHHHAKQGRFTAEVDNRAATHRSETNRLFVSNDYQHESKPQKKRFEVFNSGDYSDSAANKGPSDYHIHPKPKRVEKSKRAESGEKKQIVSDTDFLAAVSRIKRLLKTEQH